MAVCERDVMTMTVQTTHFVGFASVVGVTAFVAKWQIVFGDESARFERLQSDIVRR